MDASVLHPVESECVARMGYDEEGEEVFVEYHGSRQVYGYRRVPARVYEEFERAESRGTFVNEVIKPGYPVRKLRAMSS
jgi:KTSC domain